MLSYTSISFGFGSLSLSRISFTSVFFSCCVADKAPRKSGHPGEVGESLVRPSGVDVDALGWLPELLPHRDQLSNGHLQGHPEPQPSERRQVQKVRPVESTSRRNFRSDWSGGRGILSKFVAVARWRTAQYQISASANFYVFEVNKRSKCTLLKFFPEGSYTIIIICLLKAQQSSTMLVFSFRTP